MQVSSTVPTLQLAGGTVIPAIGFGLYKVPGDDVGRVVADAIAAGYRLLDGAAFYSTEAELGRAVRESGKRRELVVTTKLWGEPQGYDETLRAFDDSERALALGGVDICMIHWPRAPRNQYVETWRALISLRNAGRIRSIGVSNFNEVELTRLGDETGELPALNQIESHPWLPQHALRAFHAEHGIVTQAWSPLARSRLLDDVTLSDIGARRGATPAQVILGWHLALGGAAVPKTTHADRMRENLIPAVLDSDDLDRIAALETGERTGTHPKDRS